MVTQHLAEQGRNIAVPVLNCQQPFATLQNFIQARNCGMICSFCMSCLSTDPQVSKSFSTLGAMLQRFLTARLAALTA